ncbi:hypothetical protein [Chlorogloeopsis fritschii]|nr:hypothetical protein [Chlorogloeopsis fritschii]
MSLIFCLDESALGVSRVRAVCASLPARLWRLSFFGTGDRVAVCHI